jgi:hypothetical protein
MSAARRRSSTLRQFGDAALGGSLCADDGQANPRLVAPAFAQSW